MSQSFERVGIDSSSVRKTSPVATAAIRPDAMADRRERYEALALPLSRLLYAMGYRLTGKSAQAEDLVQETYVTAWKKFDGFQEGTNFKAWIMQIMVFLQKNQRRSPKAREVNMDFTESEPLAAPSAREKPVEKPLQANWSQLSTELLEDEFKQALDRLEEDQRSILLLVTLGELTYQECAEALEIPIGTVMSRLFRARKQLQGELHEYAKQRGFVK